MLLFLTADQAVAHQHPVHRGPRRRRRNPCRGEFEGDPPGTPARMCPPHLTRESFDVGPHPGRAGPGPPRCLLQRPDTPGRVLRHPRVDRLPRHPVADGHLADRRSVQYLEDSPKALLCQPVPIASLCSTRQGEPASQIETELVKDVPRTISQQSSEAAPASIYLAVATPSAHCSPLPFTPMLGLPPCRMGCQSVRDSSCGRCAESIGLRALSYPMSTPTMR
jgi:hypothetical protein